MPKNVNCPGCNATLFVTENSTQCRACGFVLTPDFKESIGIRMPDPNRTNAKSRLLSSFGTIFFVACIFMMLIVFWGIGNGWQYFGKDESVLTANSGKPSSPALPEKPPEVPAKPKQEVEENPDPATASSTANGSVIVTTSEAKETKSTESHIASGSSNYVWVYAIEKNSSSEVIHANPNDWSLQTPDGITVSHHIDTYTLGNYFDAVNLHPGGIAGGWLIFYIPHADRYYLNYSGIYGSAQVLVKIAKPPKRHTPRSHKHH